MAFKCCCIKCDDPLYFDEAVPVPQGCAKCLFGDSALPDDPFDIEEGFDAGEWNNA